MNRTPLFFFSDRAAPRRSCREMVRSMKGTPFMSVIFRMGQGYFFTAPFGMQPPGVDCRHKGEEGNHTDHESRI